MTLLVRGAAQAHPVVVVRRLAELCAALHAHSNRDHHSGAHLAAFASGLDPELQHRAAFLAPLWDTTKARYFFPMRHPNGRQDEIDVIAQLSTGAFATMSADAICDNASSSELTDLLGLPEQQSQFLRRVEHTRVDAEPLATMLIREPGAVREELVSFLRVVRVAAFDAVWDCVHEQLHQQSVQLANDVIKNGWDSLGSLDPTIRIATNPDRIIFDKITRGVLSLRHRSCLLIPSMFIRPHLVIKHGTDLPVVIQFGIPLSSREAQSVVQRRLQALNDPTRSRICRLLMRTPHTTAAIAENFDMSRPQASRHLRALREAGLVTVERQAQKVYYRLSVDAIERLGSDLIDTWRR